MDVPLQRANIYIEMTSFHTGLVKGGEEGARYSNTQNSNASWSQLSEGGEAVVLLFH